MTKLFQRVALKDLVASQLPEFIRAEYPTFVAFVEAYYEFLENNSIDLFALRDIDETLVDFIKYFKAELAHNYPLVSDSYDTERFLLKHIKEQYLAKGSEASYKLLFRLLYGKDVYIDYPGRQMLRISDGRWTQDVSLFVQVLQGNPFNLIGKTVTVQTAKRIFNLKVIKNVDAASTINATVESVIPVDEAAGIYELYVNRNFYGDISPKDSIKYGSEFQAQILPSTAKVKIREAGKNFKPGMVFQLQSGEGSPFWFKVSSITDVGGLKTIDVIRFGLDYKTDFSITVLPASAVSSKKKIKKNASSTIAYNITNDLVSFINITSQGSGYTAPPVITIQSNTGTGATAVAVLGTGANAGKVVSVNTTNRGSGYKDATILINNAPGDVTGIGFDGTVILGSHFDYNFSEKIDGFTEGGYLSSGDYWDVSESGRSGYITATLGTGGNAGKVTALNIINGGVGYVYSKPTIDICVPLDNYGKPVVGGVKATATCTVTNGVITGVTITNQGSGYTTAPIVKVYGAYGYANGAYVGTIQRQFFINASDTQGKDPALLDVSLGAVVKYPGYYKTNDGFLDDSMFIQDSYYYQAFAYVLKIDEQLQSYASVVRSMLHPSGMAMFGEYSINNKISLGIGLDSLVKSLGITLYDSFGFTEIRNYAMIKDLSDSRTITEQILSKYFFKSLTDSFTVTHNETQFSKVYGKKQGFDSDVVNQQVLVTDYFKQLFTKVPTQDFALLNNGGEVFTKVIDKNVPITDSRVTMVENSGANYPLLNISLNMTNDTLTAANFGSSGYIIVDPYDQGGYFEGYYANSRPSTWSS